MIKKCDICGGEMTKVRDAWNFRDYYICMDCGATEGEKEDGM